MQLRNSAASYGAVPKSLHWLTVALVVSAWLLGTFGDDLPRGAVQSAGLFTHISCGLAVVALLVLRVAWRIFDPPPPAEITPLGHWLAFVATATHVALYLLLAASPIVGIALQFARGDALPLFAIIDIASPWARDRAFAHVLEEVHETLSDLLMIVAGLHAMAALVHHWVWRDRTLTRMLPGTSR